MTPGVQDQRQIPTVVVVRPVEHEKPSMVEKQIAVNVLRLSRLSTAATALKNSTENTAAVNAL